MDRGYYPMDLVLSMETSNSFKDLENMDPHTKAYYYLFIMEKNKREVKEMNKNSKGYKTDSFGGSNLE